MQRAQHITLAFPPRHKHARPPTAAAAAAAGVAGAAAAAMGARAPGPAVPAAGRRAVTLLPALLALLLPPPLGAVDTWRGPLPRVPKTRALSCCTSGFRARADRTWAPYCCHARSPDMTTTMAATGPLSAVLITGTGRPFLRSRRSADARATAVEKRFSYTSSDQVMVPRRPGAVQLRSGPCSNTLWARVFRRLSNCSSTGRGRVESLCFCACPRQF